MKSTFTKITALILSAALMFSANDVISFAQGGQNLREIAVADENDGENQGDSGEDGQIRRNHSQHHRIQMNRSRHHRIRMNRIRLQQIRLQQIRMNRSHLQQNCKSLRLQI